MMQIKRINDKEFFTAIDNSRIVELYGIPTTGLKEVSLAYAVVPAKSKTEEHFHRFLEIYVIVKGKGVMHLNEEKKNVREGDHILIPAKSWHFLENTEKKELELYCICVPAFSPEKSKMREK